MSSGFHRFVHSIFSPFPHGEFSLFPSHGFLPPEIDHAFCPHSHSFLRHFSPTLPSFAFPEFMSVVPSPSPSLSPGQHGTTISRVKDSNWCSSVRTRGVPNQYSLLPSPLHLPSAQHNRHSQCFTLSLCERQRGSPKPRGAVPAELRTLRAALEQTWSPRS
jgi:hypothetical protein